MKKIIYPLVLTIFLLSACTSNTNEKTLTENLPLSDTSEENDTSASKAKEATKEECDKINIGMSTDEVKGILGEPFEKNESKSATGKTEFWSYQDAGTFSQAEKCHLTFNDGLVFTTNWFDPK